MHHIKTFAFTCQKGRYEVRLFSNGEKYQARVFINGRPALPKTYPLDVEIGYDFQTDPASKIAAIIQTAMQELETGST